MNEGKEISFDYNDAELTKLFNSLGSVAQDKIVVDAIKEAASTIISAAKSNLFASKRGASKTNYSWYASAFKVEPLKFRTGDAVGVKLGVKTKEGYKLRWLEWGTAQRETRGSKYMAKRAAGKQTGSHFFYNAVAAQKEKARLSIEAAVEKSLEKMVDKANKK